MQSEQAAYHVPVLLKESVDGLNIHGNSVYVDVTFGGGGHSKEILSRLHKAGGGRLFGFDRDKDAAANVPEDDSFTFIWSDFRWLKNWMMYYEVEQIDGLIADLGVSGHHFDDPSRGFSLRFDGPLDMRMNRLSARTAADILAEESEERLADIFYYYGELRQARRLAALVVKQRRQKPVATTMELLRLAEPLFPKERGKKEAAKMFQALRMEVNGEAEALCKMLKDGVELLRTGGRMAVITYHSIEDRIVKNILRSGNEDGEMSSDIFGNRQMKARMSGNKVTVPSQEEIERNPRSRSAKLRVAEKI